MAGEMSKILIYGGTGYVGKEMVKASMTMGHPTYVYARPLTPNTTPSKIQLHHHFQSMGVTIIQGELDEHEKLVSIMKQVDVVISTLAIPQLLDQLQIIEAMKFAGNIKRFIPSDFGCEEDRITALPPFQACLDKKKRIRRATEEAEIPYTYVSSTCFAEYFLNHLFNPNDPPDELKIYGTGEAKVSFTSREDIAIYTIEVANDPRTCNKTVVFRPPHNVLSQLELVPLWEKKTGRIHKKVHVSEEDIVKLSETSEHPLNVQSSILHSIFVKGDTTNFELGEHELEVSKLYPDFEYAKIDKIIDSFVANPPKLEFTPI